MKYIATVEITDPQEVTAKLSTMGWEYKKGMIYVSVPELDLIGSNLIPVRYGLSLPYFRVQKTWKVLIEPTTEDMEDRWFYTGLVDCGTEDISPDTNMQMLLQFASQVIYAQTDNTLHLSATASSEPLLLGNKFKTWIENFITSIFNAHTHVVVTTAAAGTWTSAATTNTGTNPSDIYSTKVFTE